MNNPALHVQASEELENTGAKELDSCLRLTTKRNQRMQTRPFYNPNMNNPALQVQASEVLENSGADELSGHTTHAALPTVSA